MSALDRMIRLWEAFPDLVEVGADSDFFSIGGYSLLAVELVAKVEDEFGVEIDLRVVLVSATPRLLAQLVSDSGGLQ